MDVHDKPRFMRAVKQLVATHMDATDPDTDERTEYGKEPDKYIDLIMVPYDPDDAQLTTPFVATIVTYEWPDRMSNIGERISAITKGVRNSFTTDMVVRFRHLEGQELISFTFLGKVPGAWCAA